MGSRDRVAQAEACRQGTRWLRECETVPRGCSVRKSLRLWTAGSKLDSGDCRVLAEVFSRRNTFDSSFRGGAAKKSLFCASGIMMSSSNYLAGSLTRKSEIQNVNPAGKP